MIAELEPFFTFEAGVRPWELGRLTLRQIHAHVDWWTAAHRSAGESVS